MNDEREARAEVGSAFAAWREWLSARVMLLCAPADDYRLVSRLFLKALALIYFAAFVSLGVQIAGLAGPDGILPFTRYLGHAREALGIGAYWHVPTLFWLDASDRALWMVSAIGAIAAMMLFADWHARLAAILAFACYLSLFHAGQIFLNFQWDTLLLESGFLAIFLVDRPTRLLVFLYYWLLFRLRFFSGLSKVVSGDPAWADFTALDHYFETQPLPHLGAWYAHWLPQWLHHAGVGFTFFVELIVPFFIFLPRPYRLFAAAVTILIQSMIIASSNHAFVNLLTIALCLFLLDDRVVRHIVPYKWREQDFPRRTLPGRGRLLALALGGGLMVFASLNAFADRFLGLAPPVFAQSLTRFAQAWGVGFVYHIFPTMQTERQELVIQGSMDGKTWKDYPFRYKPQALDEMTPFIVPHHPRLDWMIWFVPSQHPVQMAWFGEFMRQLRKGSKPVIALLRNDPFPDRPPRYLRVRVYRYRFTDPREHEATGNWWKREYLGEFPNVPPRRP